MRFFEIYIAILCGTKGKWLWNTFQQTEVSSGPVPVEVSKTHLATDLEVNYKEKVVETTADSVQTVQ